MDSLHILAIDDDIRHLASVKRILRRSGYGVSTANCGQHALRLAENQIPDLILIDVSMPTMSGHEFIHRFRRTEARLREESFGREGAHLHPLVPVVFLSARSESHHRVSGLDVGAVDYIVKPFNPEELRARVRTHLRRYQRELNVIGAIASSHIKENTDFTKSFNRTEVFLG